jgi:hypothetical protein
MIGRSDYIGLLYLGNYRMDFGLNLGTVIYIKGSQASDILVLIHQTQIVLCESHSKLRFF